MMDWVIVIPLILIVCLFNLYLNTITTIKEEKKKEPTEKLWEQKQHTIPK